MIFDAKIEDKIKRTEKKLKELSISLQRLNEQYHFILEVLEMDPEELKEFDDATLNFSSPIWKELQIEKEKWDERLNKQLNSIPDPVKSKLSFLQNGKIQQHWLFVR